MVGFTFTSPIRAITQSMASLIIFRPIVSSLIKTTQHFVDEGSNKLLTRVSGEASGEDWHGHVGDLALSVMREDVRVMVIKAHEVVQTSTCAVTPC